MHCLHYARVAVAHEGHVVVNVEEGAACVVVKILHPSAHDFQRLMVRNGEIFPEQVAASSESVRGIWLLAREALGRNAEQQIGVRGERSPDVALGCVSNSGKIGTVVKQVHDDLEMKVRRPAAVFVRVPDAGELLSARDELPHLERFEYFSREVPVEREKLCAVLGCVTKNH